MEEYSNKDLDELMGKIDQAMKMSDERQTNIDSLRKEMGKIKKVALYEEKKQKVEELEENKKEFDEMTVGALVNAKKETLKAREIIGEEYKEALNKANEEYKKTYKEVEDKKKKQEEAFKRLEDRIEPNMIDKVKEASRKSLENANKALNDASKKFLELQDEYKDNIKQIDDYEAKINKYAEKLGAIETINAVKLEDDKEKKDEPEKNEHEEIEPEEVEQEAVEPEETEPEEAELEETEPEEIEPEEAELEETEPEEIEPEEAELEEAEPEETEPEEVEQEDTAHEEADTKKTRSEKNAQKNEEPLMFKNIKISNKKVKRIDSKGKEDTDTFITIDDCTIDEFEEAMGEKYSPEVIQETFNDPNLDVNILASLIDNEEQFELYLASLGHFNKNKDFANEDGKFMEVKNMKALKKMFPNIEYDLQDRKGTDLKERFEKYKKAIKTKKIFKEIGLEQSVDIKTNYLDKVMFGIMGKFEEIKQNKTIQRITKSSK